ncbi:5'-flap endonuclease [Taxawa tesnikishii (nom. ined.)]|nr:5'-flap endonuclease [Dothideales sp. JES 119]
MARKSRAKAGTSDAADGKGVKKPKGKGKAKPTTESVVEELYLPERALREMQQQDFLFATSSQLAREESPAFLRDLQQAMKESEAMTSSQMAGPLDATSCVIVPSAPHGTCLSIGQANRGHWRASARDFDQGTLAPDEAVFLPQGEPLAMTQIPLVQYDEPDGFCERQTPEPVPGLDPRDKEKTTSDSVFHRRDLRIDHDDESQDSGFIDIDDTGKDAENTWKTLAVDEPLQTASASRSMPRVSASQTTFQRNAPLLSHPAPDSNTGTMQRQRTVSPQRLPLQPLDANVDVLKSIHSVNPKSASTARNIASTTSKSLTTGCGNNPQNEPVSPIKKSRGRPRKGPVAPDPTAPPKRRGRPPKTQPLPEPPRGSPTKPPSRASKLSRSDPSTYASAFLTLFPQITRTIKSAPPTTDLSNPSWNEKILLYDPIVLEDLTEWLHAQGLVVEISRSKKPLDDAGDAEMEVVKEDLKPWVVQKWCEENSVCCLWKEGLRGGVRQRY